MRRKRLIIISVILSIFAVMIVLAGTIFTLRNVEIDIASANNLVISENQREEIIKSAKFNYGGNLLFMNFSKQIANIESENAYVKVEKIERKFPNKIVVHITERVPAVCAETEQFVYVLDKDLKVLNVVYKEQFTPENTELPAGITLVPKINIDNIEGTKLGAKLNMEEEKYIVQSFAKGILTSGGKMTDLSEIVISHEPNGELRLLVLVHNRNLKILFKGIDDLATKIFEGYSLYCETEDSSDIFEQMLEISAEGKYVFEKRSA